MATDRNPYSDLEAIAAMPGLEELAAVCEPWANRRCPTSMLIFTAGQWAAGSRNRLHSMLQHSPLWESVRQSAARVGRQLPERPPTQDQLDKFRRDAPDDLGLRLALALTPATRHVVDAVGLLPDVRSCLHRPSRANMVWADGSKFSSLTGVVVDPTTGEYVGSRSIHNNPRVSPHQRVSARNNVTNDVPIEIAGVHGGQPLLRCILGVGVYPEGNEEDAALAVLRHVHGVYGSRIHAVIYDRLLSSHTQRNLVRLGIIPVVDTKNADAGRLPHTPVPADMQQQLGTKTHPRITARIALLAEIDHTPHCRHQLWALDNAIVDTGEDTHPTFNHPVAELTNLEFSDGELNATYRVPCRHGDVRHTIDLAGLIPGTRTPVLEYVRPLQITDALTSVRGWRSPVESAFAQLQQSLPHADRVRSLHINNIFQDFVGGALHINAVAWDVHAARHTSLGKQQAQSLHRRQRPQPVI